MQHNLKPWAWSNVGPATRNLSMSVLIAGIVFSTTERLFGFGTNDLIFSVERIVSNFEIWRFLTYPWAGGSLFSLLISTAVLWFFSASLEQRWGSLGLYQFFGVSVVGAALFAVPLYYVSNFVFSIFKISDIGVDSGTSSVTTAMLMYLVLTAPKSNILLGFVLPVPARTVLYVILGLQVVGGLIGGAFSLAMTLGGLAIGYLLTTGNWRSRRLRALLDLKFGKKRTLHIVRDSDETLH